MMVEIEDGGLDFQQKVKKLDFAVKDKIPAFFEAMCPNCFFGITSYRLNLRNACDFCMEETEKEIEDPLELGEILMKTSELRKFKNVYFVEKQLNDFNEFFKKLTNSELWSAQKVWARRVFNGQSSAIIAPTGVGKTVFGLILSLYFAHKMDKFSYIVLPTTTLLRQIVGKLQEWEEKIGKSYVIYFHSGLTKKQKEEMLRRLEEGDFRVLVTTSQFLVRNLQLVLNAFTKAKNKPHSPPVDFMFVDDVDSFLRNPNNLDRALTLLGYKQFKRIREILDKLKKPFYLSGQGGGFFKLSDDDWSVIFNVRKKTGQIVVSSATGRIGGSVVRRIFSTLFGFSIGSSREGVRNIVDTYDSQFLKSKDEDPVKRAVELVKKLGSGGLIFISRGVKSDEIIERLESTLKSEGIKALGVTAEDSRGFQKVIEDYRKGEIDVLIGKASAYGLLVRGLDLPERVRYAIFLEVPHYAIKLEIRPNPYYLSFVMRKLSPLIAKDKGTLEKIRVLSTHTIWLKPADVKKLEEQILMELSTSSLDELIEKYKKKTEDAQDNHELNSILLVLQLSKILEEFLASNPIEKLKESDIPYMVREENGEKSIYLLTADVKTYIQASGRTSRLYAGGITKGLSIIVSKNKTLIKELDSKLFWSTDSTLTPLEDIDLDKLLKEIDEDRKNVILAREGKIPTKGHLQTCLFIVESPTKAKTIANFFGRPSRRFLPGLVAYEVIMGRYLATIVATMGHITELVTHKFTPIFDYKRENGKLTISVKGFKIEELKWPYGILTVNNNGKTRYVPIFGPRVTCNSCGYTFIPYFTISSHGKKLSKKIFKFLREPHVDLSQIENLFGKTMLPLKCPRCGESENLFDRLIMLESLRKLASESEFVIIGTDPDIEGEKIAWDLTLLLKPYSKQIKRAEFHEVTKTAIEKALQELRDIDEGLVKGQLLRRIEDRWIGFYLSMKLREILDERNLSAGRVQSPVLKWIIDAYNEYKIKEDYTIITSKDGLEIRIKGNIKPLEIIVNKVQTGEKTLYPRPPLVTDTLLNFASNIYGLSANDTMKYAQKLFELGLITYIRTDSTRVSNLGINVAKKIIANEYDEKLFVARTWSKGEEGAHECIRPTKPLMLYELEGAIERGEITLTEELPADALSLYDMIVRFFIASQMKEARVKSVEYELTVKYEDENGEIKQEKVKISGYTKVIDKGFLTALSKKMIPIVTPTRLPELKEGTIIKPDVLEIRHEKVPKGRLPTEGDIVRMMKERGIGRPSTYANIIAKLKERQYVRLLYNRYLAPKTRGIIVNRILERLHKDMVSEERTRIILQQIDAVVEGKQDYEELLREIYNEILEDMKAKEGKSLWDGLPEDLKVEIENYKMKTDKRKLLYNVSGGK